MFLERDYMEIKELEIDLNIEGWDYSGGRSYNVWGLVDIKNLPFKIIEESIANNKKSCIWTCYDDILYINDANGNLLPIDYSKLPSTISATFKPTYQKYTAIVENLAMKKLFY